MERRRSKNYEKLRAEAIQPIQNEAFVNGTEVPQLDLCDVFKHCDLITRRKLRRVSRYWKFLTSLKENSRTVIIDFRCLYVSNPRALAGFTGKCLDSHKYSIFRSLHYGWSDLVKGGDGRSDFVRLSDHRRHGLLGGHVRTLIYNGQYDPITLLVQHVAVIQSIGKYCRRARHLVLWHVGRNLFQGEVGHGGGDLLGKSYFAPCATSKLPQPLRLTVVNWLELEFDGSDDLWVCILAACMVRKASPRVPLPAPSFMWQ